MTAKKSRTKKGEFGASAEARTKKRPALSSEPLSEEERERAHGLLQAAGDLLRAYAEDVDDPTLSDRKRVDLRTDLRLVADFVERANGGKLFDRNRRWALLYELTKDARERGERPSVDEVARWDSLPRAYAASSKDAVRARELLARSVAARSRYEWQELLVEAIAELEADEMGDHKWLPEAFEATVLAHQREERRVLGVSDDES